MLDSFARAGGALVLSCAALLGAAAHAADAPRPVPAEDFFRHPEMAGAALSPSGRQVGVLLGAANGRRVLGVVDLEGGAPAKIVGAFSEADVRSFHWVNDKRLVYSAIDLKAGSGDQSGADGLFAVNADGSGFRRLVRRRAAAFISEGNTRIESRELAWNHVLRSTSRDGSDDVIVQRLDFNDLGDMTGSALLRVNTVTGSATHLTLGAPARASSWVVDTQGRPRVVTTEQDGILRLYWREAEGTTWTLLSETPYLDERIRPLAVDEQGRLLVRALRGDAARTAALYRYDVRTRQLEPEPLLALAGFDFDGALETASDGRLVGAHYTSDAAGSAWFDPAWRAVQERVDQRLKATANRFDCGRCDAATTRVVVRAASDRQPAVYYLYDRKADTLERLGASRSWIEPKRMAERSFERIKARDGLELPLYLTRPAGKGPFPAVVLVHGGPYLRGGDWEWSEEAQFLASRGYLVIEPEFRGSRGFGDRHVRAGFRQWGLAMQDDLADAALWAVQQGLADRGRIAIAGASYGGYAALMGLVRHPELYRCAVNWVGVTDIDLMYSLVRSDLSAEYLRFGMPVLVGDRVKDAAQLEATSPLKQASRITRPVLMAYGGNDWRVPIEHGTRMRDALMPHNKSVEWVTYADEGHGFLLEKNQVDFWQRVERFLARELAPPAPAVAAGS